MATVRISHRLYDEIVDNFRDKYTSGNPKPNQSPELLSAVRQGLQTMPAVLAFDTLLSSPAVQHEMTTSSDMGTALARASKSDVTQIRIRNISNHKRGQEIGGTTELHLDLPTPVKLPYGNNYGHYDVSIDSFDSSIREELHTKVAAAVDAGDEWDEKFNEATKQIRNVLDQCNTIKQLLSVWPAAEKLLPSEVIQKLHTKVTRNVDKEKVLDTSGFDEQLANQVILTANLLGD